MDFYVEFCVAYDSENDDCDGFDNKSSSDDNDMSQEEDNSDDSKEGLSDVCESDDGNSISSDE